MTLLGGDLRGPQAGFLVQGEFAFTYRDFRRIAALLHGAAGYPEVHVISR